MYTNYRQSSNYAKAMLSKTSFSLFLLNSFSLFAAQADISESSTYFTSSSKAITTSKTAEAYFAKGTPESIQKGILLLESILSDSSFKRLDTEQKMHIFIKLAEAYEKSNEFQKGDALLLNLLEHEHYQPYAIRLQVELIRSYLVQGRLEDAEQLLRKLLKISKKSLTRSERESVTYVLEWYARCYEKILAEADTFFKKQRYIDAIPRYKRVLTALQKRSFPLSSSEQTRNEYYGHITYKMAYALFLNNDYIEAINLLESLDHVILKESIELYHLYQEGLYLLACTLDKSGDIKGATAAYRTYCEEAPNEVHIQDARYRLGCLYFVQEDYVNAEKILQVSIQEGEDASLYIPTALLLAHTGICTKKFSICKSLLVNIKQNCPKGESPYNEARFLEGILALESGDIEAGARALEEAVVLQQVINKNNSSPPWFNEAQYHLAQAYLKLAEEKSLYDPEEAAVFLDRSETCLEMAKHTYKGTQLALLHAQLFYIRWHAERKPHYKEKVKDILQTIDQNGHPEIALPLHLILVKMCESSAEKFVLFKAIESALPLSCSYKPYLLLKTTHLLEEANLLISKGKSGFAQKTLEEAIASSMNLIHLINKNTCTPEEITALSHIATQLLTLNRTQANEVATAILKSFPLEDHEGLMYLRSISALEADADDGEAVKFLTEHPQSIYVPYLLHALANSYATSGEVQKCVDTIHLIQHNFPNYENEDHLLFLLAQESDTSLETKENARAYRKELLTTYPDSLYAPEAHFRYFPEEEYRRGTPHAIDHLQTMCDIYPKSPFSIAAYYYIGLYKKSEAKKRLGVESLAYYKDAIHAFTQAEALYDELKNQELLETQLHHVIQRFAIFAGFQKGKMHLAANKKGTNSTTHISLAHLNEAKECFEKTIHTTVSATDIDQMLGLESRYRLAQTLELLDFDELAMKELQELSKLCDAHESGAYIRIKSQIGLARIATKTSNFDAASKYFALLELGTQLERYPELRLKVLIEKSNFYKKMQRFDKAMTLLSKVINDNLASQLRIKAMVLRADIYQLQRRNDLAVKQLEAASKHGGEWGNVAKRKLEGIYGYN